MSEITEPTSAGSLKRDATNHDGPGARGGVGRAAVDLLGVLTVFFVIGGAPVPHVNETHYLTKAKHAWDASYCRGDMFLDSADAHAVFYWTIGWLTRLMSLPAVAWAGRIAEWLLLAAGWRALWRAARVPSARTGRLGLLLSAALFALLGDRFNFAGEWVIGGVEAKCFAYGLVLFGLAAMVRGNWRTPWGWFGAAAMFHVLVGGWAVVAALGVWLSEPRGSRPGCRTLAPGLLIGALLSLPGVLPALMFERGVDKSTAAEAARIQAFERLPHHLAPLSLPPDELHQKATRYGMLIAVMTGLWVWARCLQPAGNHVAVLDSSPRAAGVERLMRFAVVSLLASGFALSLEWKFTHDAPFVARLLRFYWFRQADVAAPLAVAVAGASLVEWWLSGGSAWQRIFALAAIAWCAGMLISAVVTRWHDGRPPALRRIEAAGDWIAACTWIRDHAPADAVCLVPRYAQSFKWYAERADVGNWKDCPQDAAGIVEWRRRMSELFPPRPIGVGGGLVVEPAELGTQRVRDLGAKYGATLVVTAADPPLDLPRAFPAAGDDVNYYAVYRIGVTPRKFDVNAMGPPHASTAAPSASVTRP